MYGFSFDETNNEMEDWDQGEFVFLITQGRYDLNAFLYLLVCRWVVGWNVCWLVGVRDIRYDTGLSATNEAAALLHVTI